MPCTYYLPGEEEAIARKELDKATRSACEALKMLESLSPAHMEALSSDTLVWWKEHKERDVLRKARKVKKSSSRKKTSKRKRGSRPKKMSRESLDKFVTRATETLSTIDKNRW